MKTNPHETRKIISKENDEVWLKKTHTLNTYGSFEEDEKVKCIKKKNIQLYMKGYEGK